MDTPVITILTPCLNALSTLPMCCASVRDQGGPAVEHIVIDGGSTDGTREWLASQPALRWISEPDRGMYDALNKGLARTRGQIVGFLNADEQYLPGALSGVAAAFECQSAADILYGDMLVVRPDGTLLAFRKSPPLRRVFVMAAHLYVPTCALFWRRRVSDSIRFDPDFKAWGDTDFILRALATGFRAGGLQRYLAAFTFSGANLGASPTALREMNAARKAMPAWLRMTRPLVNLARYFDKAWHGAYRAEPALAYELYTRESLERRVLFRAEKPTCRWPESGAVRA